MNKPKAKRALSPLQIKVSEATQTLGNLLTGYLKSGPLSKEHGVATEQQILALATSIMGTPQCTADEYRANCERFLEDVIRVKGMPVVSVITAGVEDESRDTVSCSGADIEKAFPRLLPSIRSRTEWCIGNFCVQAQRYFDIRIGEFRELLASFLVAVPVGGTTDKAIKSQITEIKRGFRSLCDWDRLFCVYKRTSLVAAVEEIFALERQPIAAIWHYNTVDEDSDAPRNDHRRLDRHIYAVRGNWAIKGGLMRVGQFGYVDDISMPPQQEIGCTCEYEWLYSIRELPGDMLTDEGRREHQRVSKAVDEWMPGRKTSFSSDITRPSARLTFKASVSPEHSGVPNRGMIALLLGWLKKRS